jgi:hypothetical protein
MLGPNVPTRSRRCANNACVEATLTAGGVRVRDTKPGGAAVLFTVDAWRHLVAGLKAQELDEEQAW